MPTSNQVLATRALTRAGDRIAGGLIPFGDGAGAHQVTDAAYLGLPLLIVLGVIAWRGWRRGRVRFFSVMILCAFLAALGPALKVDGHTTGIDLPERILTHLPLLQASVPFRYGLFVALGAAIVLALGVDGLREHLAGSVGGRVGSRIPRAAPAALAACALIPLIPRLPYTVVPTRIPPFFTDGSASVIPSGSVALTYPPPTPQTSATMTWQASANMRYRMIGAYMYAPDGHGGFSLIPNHSPTEALLYGIWAGAPVPAATPSLRSGLRVQLRRWRVSSVIVATGQPHAERAVALLTAVLGRPPRQGGGVALCRTCPVRDSLLATRGQLLCWR